jgi:hypothetical protein
MPIEDYLEKGYHVDRYYVLEEDFTKFLGFLPLEFYPTEDDRTRIRSTYLADLLLRIGSSIDIFFKKYIDSYPPVSRFMNLENNASGILNWRDYKKIDQYIHLSDRHVSSTLINDPAEQIFPFRLHGQRSGNSWVEINQNEPSFWWNAYNKVKHEGTFDKANLENVLQSLSALILLISHHPHNMKLNRYGYLQKSQMPVENEYINTKLFIVEKLYPPGVGNLFEDY